MKNLRIALVQVRQTGIFEENTDKIFEYIEKAAKEKIQILCFPETQTAGYRADITPPDTPIQPEKLEEVHRNVAKRCGELGMACLLGTEIPLESDPKGGKPYNSVITISPKGKVLGVHHKTRLTPLDAVHYTQGETFETYDLFGVKVGVVICFEGFRFAHTTEECVRQGAQLVFHPQNNTTRPNDWKIPVHHSMITTRAAENTVWFASCNICEPKYQNCSSMIIAPDGQIHAKSELKKEQLIISEIDIDLATKAMFDYDFERCAPILYSDTVKREEFDSILNKMNYKKT